MQSVEWMEDPIKMAHKKPYNLYKFINDKVL